MKEHFGTLPSGENTTLYGYSANTHRVISSIFNLEDTAG